MNDAPVRLDRYKAHRPRLTAPSRLPIFPPAARSRPRSIFGNPSICVEYLFVLACLAAAAALWRIGQGG